MVTKATWHNIKKIFRHKAHAQKAKKVDAYEPVKISGIFKYFVDQPKHFTIINPSIIIPKLIRSANVKYFSIYCLARGPKKYRVAANR